MKKTLIIFSAVLMALVCISSPSLSKGSSSFDSSKSFHTKSNSGIIGVKGHIKSSGTYVPPHYKTSPNKTKIDNWSTKGNINPFTGSKGLKKID